MKKAHLTIFIALLIGLIIGYFIGREHLKRELSSVVNQIVVNPLGIASTAPPTKEDLKHARKMQELKQRNLELQKESQRLQNDPAYLEQKAKERIN